MRIKTKTSRNNNINNCLYKQLSLLKVDDILKLQQLKFYYKYPHNDLPRYLDLTRFNKI